ncbi:MAG: hypothetical protein ACLQU3_03710 [Limisphaerales bacterium]
MHRSFIASIIWLVFVSSTWATSVELPVTPTNLDTYFCTFSVLTNATKDGVAFHVTITNKQSDIYPDSSADVDMVIHKKLADGGMEGSVGPVTPPIPVELKKEKRLWTADFTVSRELLKNPDVHFVFGVLAHSTVDGKIIPMPSITFYELRLQEFAKP